MNRKLAATVLVWSVAISACTVQEPARVVAADTKAKTETPVRARTVTPAKAAKRTQKADRPQKPISEYTLDEILSTLRNQTAKLTSYRCKVDYLFIQDPELLDSRTLRKGILYYLKDAEGSRIRVNFDTIKQDDGKETANKEQFMFDGIWLTKIDYHLKKVDRWQRVRGNKAVDVFEYVSYNFPIVGFSKTENLSKQFDIKVLDQPSDAKKPIRLHLKVKKDSVYKDDYTDIEFWIDSRTFLPARIISRSTEEDILDIHLLDAIVNKKLQNTVFKVEPPHDFRTNRHPLKKG